MTALLHPMAERMMAQSLAQHPIVIAAERGAREDVARSVWKHALKFENVFDAVKALPEIDSPETRAAICGAATLASVLHTAFCERGGPAYDTWFEGVLATLRTKALTVTHGTTDLDLRRALNHERS